MASIERNPAALSLFKRIVRELKQSNKHFSPQHPLYKNMFNQLRIHQTTQKIGLKASNEVHHTADVFATYLQSRRQLSELHQKYCKGERTIDQTARMVGLELPQRWEEHKHSNNGTGQ